MLALFFPAIREGLHEIGEAEAVRLAAIQDGFDDVGCQLGHLKDLSDDDLEMIRQQLIKEVREVGRALHWIDGIIKLKSIEQKPSNPVVEVRS